MAISEYPTGAAQLVADTPIGTEQQDFIIQLNALGHQLIAQGLPLNAERVRRGNSWWVLGAAAAPVTALPTTTAQNSLWNGEAAGGKILVIDSLILLIATSQTVAGGFGAVLMLNPPTVTAPTSAAITFRSLSGKTNYGGKAILAAGLTGLTNSGWMPWGSSYNEVGATNLMTAIDVPVDGKIQVPPGGMLNGSVIANAATGTIQLGFRWHEIQMPQG